MKFGSTFGKIAAVLSAGLIAVSAQAGFWDWTRPFKGPGRHVSTLVITGNYKRPLALAQLIRAESRQPYLLIPAQESGLKDVFFCPVNERTPAVKLRKEDISRFVRLLNPAKVIVLGDTRYVPESYVPALDGRIPIVRIDCDDWARNAQMLGSLLNLNYLESDYKRIGAKLDKDTLYRPLPSRPAPKPAQVVVPKAEEPKAEVPVAEEVKPEPAPAVVAEPVKEAAPTAGEVTPVGEIKSSK
ncbi:MAG: hypothetical protein E7052_07935 [Lentisphaerae bacterium]|nr:hypothetical protein [Lentisphaerota bacterium]